VELAVETVGLCVVAVVALGFTVPSDDHRGGGGGCAVAVVVVVVVVVVLRTSFIFV
jgi:hypothetical protein